MALLQHRRKAIDVPLGINQRGRHFGSGPDHIIIGVPIKLLQAGDAVFLAVIVKGKRDKANSQFLQQRAIQVGSGIGKDFVQDTEPSFI